MVVKKKAAENWTIEFGRSDLVRCRKVITAFGPVVDVRARGWWKHASDQQLWEIFVGEFAVRGGVRLIERLEKDKKRRKQYRALISLRSLVTARTRSSRLHRAMRMATRFWPDASKRFSNCLRNPSVVKGPKFVLLENLPAGGDDLELRELIMKRCPELGRKGASDFLIGVGAARNLVAIDTRIIGCLEKYFSAGPEIKSTRSSKAGYLALESALRKVLRPTTSHSRGWTESFSRHPECPPLNFSPGARATWRRFRLDTVQDLEEMLLMLDAFLHVISFASARNRRESS